MTNYDQGVHDTIDIVTKEIEYYIKLHKKMPEFDLLKKYMKQLKKLKGRQGCSYCNYESQSNEIYQDSLTKDWYLDIATSQWDSYYDDWHHERIYIQYCPYCGRRLDNEQN